MFLVPFNAGNIIDLDVPQRLRRQSSISTSSHMPTAVL
jgi:hypothetical protein